MEAAKLPVPPPSCDPLGLLTQTEDADDEVASQGTPQVVSRWPPPVVDDVPARGHVYSGEYDPSDVGVTNFADPRNLPVQDVKVQVYCVNGYILPLRGRGEPRTFPAVIPLQRGSPRPSLLVSIPRARIDGVPLPRVDSIRVLEP